MKKRIDEETLHPKAHAIQPVRMDERANAFIYYEATTFPKGPWRGCEWTLRQLRAFGFLKDDGSNLVLDILDEEGDILQDFPITRKGFEYLRRRWKFEREPVAA
jgi:hypothetical protein